jgi:hypothetical protein
MGAVPTKTFPQPSAVGGSQAVSPLNAAQAPIAAPLLGGANQATMAATPAVPAAPTPPMGAKGTALMPGQASPPIAGTPLNPWGVNRGGSGLIPTYRRPGTLS